MLFLFVEGDDDETFIRKIYDDLSLDDIKVIPYSREKKEKISSYLRSVACMRDCSYIFFCDSDGKASDVRIQELHATFKNLDSEKIVVVCYEIESWYYAGVSKQYCLSKKLKSYEHNTNTLTKGRFDRKLPPKTIRKLIMLDMLQNYSYSLAVQRNSSFSMFYHQNFPN